MINVTERSAAIGKAEPFECWGCPGCGSKFTYELEDARIGYSLGYPSTANIDCPVCGCEWRLGMTTKQQAIAWRDRKTLRKA